MNVVLRIAGILLAALGLLAVLLFFYSPEFMASGMNLNTGVSLLLGGIVILGLSGVVGAVEDLRSQIAGEEPGPTGFVGLRGRKKERTAALAAGQAHESGEKPAVAMPEAARTVEPAPAEQRQPPFATNQDMEAKLRSLDPDARSAIDRVVEEVREHGSAAAGEAEVVSEENLYVVEVREIAGKQARVLSDGTVEAETDEGWMRFENPEHLEEYVAAMNVNVGRR